MENLPWAFMSLLLPFAGLGKSMGHVVNYFFYGRDDLGIGVVAESAGRRTVVRARGGVVFASGGFAQDVGLRTDVLAAPILGTCGGYQHALIEYARKSARADEPVPVNRVDLAQLRLYLQLPEGCVLFSANAELGDTGAQQ
jgi:hypothetical protein